MAPNKIDDFFKKTIEKSAAHYTEKAPKSKEEVWRELMNDTNSKSMNWRRLLAVASVILLLILSSLQYYSIKEKNSLIAQMKNQITQLEKENKNAQIALQNIPLETITTTQYDTVIIEKTVLKKETITLVEYITDTVYIPETKTHENNQLARIEDMEEVKNEAAETMVNNADYSVEFFLEEKNEPAKTRKSLESLLMGYAKSKTPGKTGAESKSLQASIKQFLSVN